MWRMSSIVVLVGLLAGCGGDDGPIVEEYTGSLLQNAWCDVSPTPCCNNCPGSPALVLALLGVATDPTGDATLTLQIAGDLDNDTDETLLVSVEGYSLGTLFNGVPGDDAFDLNPDSPSDCTLTTTSATVPLADLQAIVADGQILVSLTPNQSNNDIEDVGCDSPQDETLTLSIRYLATS